MIRLPSLSLVAAVLAGCSSTPTTGPDPEIESQARKQAQGRQEVSDTAKMKAKVLLELHAATDKYFEARSKMGDPRARDLMQKLDTVIRQQVQRNFDLLVFTAKDVANKTDRGVALRSLGFCDESKEERETRLKKGLTKGERPVRQSEIALDALTTALSDDEDWIVESALLGFAVLAAHETPVAEIAAILEDEKRSLAIRENASFALMVMQDHLVAEKTKPIRPACQRVLMQPLGEVDSKIVIGCLRSLGRFRQPADATIVEPYCAHPTPLVRVAAAIALGRMQNQQSYKTLLKMIDDAERNKNVRLAARKGLKALAGGVDHGYDVKLWERLFERR